MCIIWWFIYCLELGVLSGRLKCIFPRLFFFSPTEYGFYEMWAQKIWRKCARKIWAQRAQTLFALRNVGPKKLAKMCQNLLSLKGPKTLFAIKSHNYVLVLKTHKLRCGQIPTDTRNLKLWKIKKKEEGGIGFNVLHGGSCIGRRKCQVK